MHIRKLVSCESVCECLCVEVVTFPAQDLVCLCARVRVPLWVWLTYLYTLECGQERDHEMKPRSTGTV